MQPLIGSDPEKISSWKILGRLGSGGMGVVYYAVDFKKSSSNEVALKIIRPHILEDSSARSRLEREIASLYSISNPYVAGIVDSEIDDTSAWIATQRVNGPSLSQWVEENGPLEFQAWLSFAYGVFSAINSIHSAGIIHRDIKPSNILLEKQGEYLVPKLIDFGIAIDQEATSLTRTGMLVGTPAWLAPEQFSGDAISPAVDIFALGSTLLYAATGKNPWGIQDTTPIGVIIGTISTGTPNIDGVNKEQKKILTQILNRNPKNRITSSEALKVIEATASEQGIRILKLGEQTTQTDNSIAKSTTRSKKPNLRAVGMVAAVLVLTGIAATAITLTGKNSVQTSVPINEKQPEKIKVIEKSSTTPRPEAKVSQTTPRVQISDTSAYKYIKELYSEVGCSGAIISKSAGELNVVPSGSIKNFVSSCKTISGNQLIVFTNKDDIALKRQETTNLTTDGGKRVIGSYLLAENVLFRLITPQSDPSWIGFVEDTLKSKYGAEYLRGSL